MRVSTASSEEALLWLTRRCVIRLWPLLVGFAESEPEIATRAADPLAKRALFEFQHEKALSQATFSKAYEDAPRARPLGDNPLLVARLQRRKTDDGRMVLGMLPAEGQGIFLTLGCAAAARLDEAASAHSGEGGMGLHPQAAHRGCARFRTRVADAELKRRVWREPQSRRCRRRSQ